MGASSYTDEWQFTDQKKFLKEFENRMAAERIYYGTNPYNGSLATLTGVQIVIDPFPETGWDNPKKREMVYDNLLERAEKWGDALAVFTGKSFIVAAWLAE